MWRSTRSLTALTFLALAGCANLPADLVSSSPFPVTGTSGDATPAPLPEPSAAVAGKPFFRAVATEKSDPLPETRLPRAEFPEIALSDALLYLMRNSTLKLAVDPSVPEKTLKNVVLQGTFANGLETLASAGGFTWKRNGNVLRLSAGERFRVDLPPFGWFGGSGKPQQDTPLDPYTPLLKPLQEAGITEAETDTARGTLSYRTSVGRRPVVEEALQQLRETTEWLAFDVAFYHLSGTKVPAPDWGGYSPDLQPLTLEDAPAGVAGWQGPFDADALTAFLAGIGQPAKKTEQGVALLPPNLPLTFAVQVPGCGKGNRPVAAKVTLQARRDGNTIRTNLTAETEGCKSGDLVTAFDLAPGTGAAVAGWGNNYAVMLQPRLVRFTDGGQQAQSKN